MLYFAYGSNMSRPRLEARIGAVAVLGAGVLRDFCHRFSKPGADGTGKGNVHPEPGAVVHGVLYRIDVGWLPELDRIEGGYRRVDVTVGVRADVHVAFTYVARAPVPFQAPSDAYLRHYEAGIREHGLPEAYWQQIIRDARR